MVGFVCCSGRLGVRPADVSSHVPRTWRVIHSACTLNCGALSAPSVISSSIWSSMQRTTCSLTAPTKTPHQSLCTPWKMLSRCRLQLIGLLPACHNEVCAVGHQSHILQETAEEDFETDLLPTSNLGWGLSQRRNVPISFCVIEKSTQIFWLVIIMPSDERLNYEKLKSGSSCIRGSEDAHWYSPAQDCDSAFYPPAHDSLCESAL